ncbi:MAG: RimK-like protein [Chloroflexi bacterium]|nr:RimK-like protein [Chloroflexota bacterium]
MTIPNRTRALVTLIDEIAADEGYALTRFSQDWILRLEKGGTARHVFGYNFEVNSATAQLLAADKAATADLLAHVGVPVVEHRLFLHPRLAGYVSAQGNWDAMQRYAQERGYPLVVKPNEGTGGDDIYKVGSALELEQAVSELFEGHRAITLSPFLEIEQEYRVVGLDGENLLIYGKERPRVLGDGQATVLELIEQLHLEERLSEEQARRILDNQQGNLKQVLAEGQELVVGWKHNLGEGAKPLMVENGSLADQLGALAKAAREALRIRFASVDIVEVNGTFSVLEINAGVMMEYFVRHYPDLRPQVKAIYAKAVAAMFTD